MTKKIELLSPAGDLERLKVTLLYGADAVYIGGKKYSLRANSTNFSIDEIRQGCDFAHKLGKKVHLTLNIVFHNEDMEGVEEYIKEVVEAGIDAFIVSDPFIISYIKKNYPEVEEKNIYISINGIDGNKFSKSVDGSKVAREFNLTPDSKKIVYVSRLNPAVCAPAYGLL